MWSSRVTYLLLTLLVMTATMVTVTIILPHAESSEPFLFESHLDEIDRWDALHAISNPIKDADLHLSHLYQQYKHSSSSNRPTIAKEILETVTKLAYLDSRIDMIALLLFGPKKSWSILRAVRDKNPTDGGLESTFNLFEKHCGVLTEHTMKQSLANVYNYVVEKEAIHEAIILACGMRKIESHGIDMANPKIHITPAPVHGSFQYCGRVSVNGIPSPKVESYGKIYQVTVVPSKSVPHKRHSMIHVCFHRNDSLGLCQCEKEDWESIQKGSWKSFIPPNEKKFVDVKFAAGISDFVTVTLDEVSPAAQRWGDGLLAGWIALLFITVSKYIFAQDGVVQSVKWVMCVLALTCIFMGYIGTSLPIVAVCSCLALYYTITSIIAPILSKMTMLWPWILFGQGLTRSDKFSKKETEELTRKMVVELVSSPGFEEWMIRRAERIKIGPCR